MESKCQKCFYYTLCVQHDYVIEDEKEITNNYCVIYEKGIPSKFWNEKEKCEDFIGFLIEKKLNEYAELFGENFPIFIVRNLEESEIIKIIDECIKNNKPYEIKDENDKYYL